MRATLICGFVLFVLLSATPAAASCAAEPSLSAAASRHAFVGRVTQIRGGVARIAVDSVWRGPDLAPVVWVQGGQAQPPFPVSLFMSAASSVDVHWSPGQVVLVGADAPDLRTNACLTTTMAAEDLADLAPPDARPPVAGGLDGAGPPVDPLPWALAAIVVLAVAVAGLAVHLRR